MLNYLESINHHPARAAELAQKDAVIMIYDLGGPLANIRAVTLEMTRHGCSRSSLSDIQNNRRNMEDRPYIVVEVKWTCAEPLDDAKEPMTIQFFIIDKRIAGALIVTPPPTLIPENI